MSYWGQPSEKPEGYWRPWLGGQCGVRVTDIGLLTPYQLEACRRYAGVGR